MKNLIKPEPSPRYDKLYWEGTGQLEGKMQNENKAVTWDYIPEDSEHFLRYSSVISQRDFDGLNEDVKTIILCILKTMKEEKGLEKSDILYLLCLIHRKMEEYYASVNKERADEGRTDIDLRGNEGGCVPGRDSHDRMEHRKNDITG